MRRLRWIALPIVLLLPAPAPAQVPVHEEPMHPPVIERDGVRVLDVRVPPGDTTLAHIHAHNMVYVAISGSRIRMWTPEGESAEATWKTGEVRESLGYAETPMTHTVVNDDRTPFHVLGIEFLESPRDSAASAAAATRLPSPVLENAHARAYRVVLDPGESTGRHTHGAAGLVVNVTGGRLDEVGPRGTSLPGAGAHHWREAGVSHDLRNTGREAVELVELEWR